MVGLDRKPLRAALVRISDSSFSRRMAVAGNCAIRAARAAWDRNIILSKQCHKCVRAVGVLMLRTLAAAGAVMPEPISSATRASA